jgi:hypothetical protein
MDKLWTGRLGSGNDPGGKVVVHTAMLKEKKLTDHEIQHCEGTETRSPVRSAGFVSEARRLVSQAIFLLR